MTSSVESPVITFGRLVGLCRELESPDGGFSVDVRSGDPVREGYVLSIHPDREQQIGGRVFPDDVVAYALANADLLARHGSVLGGWRDGDTGIAYLDVSTVVYDRREAVRLCREFGQLAFFDVSAGREVRVS